MMRATVDQLMNILMTALREPIQRKAAIADFQDAVWRGLDPELPSAVREILRDLAYDLDFFESKPAIRDEDESLYGNRRAEREILAAFGRLRAAGVETPEGEGTQR